MKFTGLLSLAALPLTFGQDYACEIPAVLSGFTIVTKGDASIGAHLTYTKSAIGGSLSDPDVGPNKVFQGHMWAGYIPDREDRSSGQPVIARNMNFNGGTTTPATLADAGIDWDHIEWLAQNLEDWESGDYKITVLYDGGTKENPLSFEHAMVTPSDTDGGKSLMVFPTNVDIWLDKLPNEHKPGPGILAPFSNVYLGGDAGYADGYIICNNFETYNGASTQTSLQLHGYPFLGTGYTCKETIEESPVASPEASPVASPTVEESGGNGDPHFKTWTGEHFEYHGQCDMVLLKDLDFAGGKGIEIQIRTKLVRYWSYIQSVAIRIGNEILEVEGSEDPSKDFKYWYNFEYQTEMESLSGFPVVFKDRSSFSNYKAGLDIDLSSMFPGEKISIAAWKEFIRVDVKNGSKASFGKSVGVLGEFESGKTLSREGVLMNDFVEYGQEWQVRPTEPMLFHKTSKPQFPAKCIQPEDPQGQRRRRLDESSIKEEQAEAACASLNDPLDRKDCVYDVLATQDLDIVGAF
ncbi:MAG: hypothetical protein SGBAC_007128 [Bacillariaceae sp.]